jgi:MSHA pilin protein MshA
MNKQSGFTIIELVVVIALLGILSAVALPRFIDVTSDAKVARIEGLEGAIASAVSLVRAKSMVDGVQNDASATVSVEGKDVSVAFGYPRGSATGLPLALTLNGDVQQVSSVTTNSWIIWYGEDGSKPSTYNCYIQYYGPTSKGESYSTKVEASGC